jgi:hypothetical protein
MHKSRLMDLISAAALTLGLCVVSTQATAAVVCVGTDSVATSCSGVVIGSTTYNVEWVLPNYLGDGGYPSGGPALTATTSGEAASAVTQINQGLTDYAFTNFEYAINGGTSNTPACSSNLVSCYYVPYFLDTATSTIADQVRASEGRYSSGVWTSQVYWRSFDDMNTHPVAVFSAVPVPAALTLFLSGMGVVGWMGSRHRQGLLNLAHGQAGARLPFNC